MGVAATGRIVLSLTCLECQTANSLNDRSRVLGVGGAEALGETGDDELVGVAKHIEEHGFGNRTVEGDGVQVCFVQVVFTKRHSFTSHRASEKPFSRLLIEIPSFL